MPAKCTLCRQRQGLILCRVDVAEVAMPRPSKAAGSVALVTGANGGIGLAFVTELAARGARKVYAGVRRPADVTDEFKELPVEVVPLDVTGRAAVQAAATACRDVNLLVN